jgi:ATP-binding cassette subfamily B multidrug efflux pump
VIVVMDGGRIVEQGSHADLLRREGFYYRLYNSQFTEAWSAEGNGQVAAEGQPARAGA